MRNSILKVIASVVFVLMFTEVWLQVLVALRGGQAFYGENCKWLPLGTYSSLVALSIVTPILVWLIAKNMLKEIKSCLKRRQLRGRD